MKDPVFTKLAQVASDNDIDELRTIFKRIIEIVCSVNRQYVPSNMAPFDMIDRNEMEGILHDVYPLISRNDEFREYIETL